MGEAAKISITDTAGHAIANLSVVAGPGLNRTVWDLKMSKDLLTEYGGEGQMFVKPGTYKVSISYGKSKDTQNVVVDIAPGIETR